MSEDKKATKKVFNVVGSATKEGCITTAIGRAWGDKDKYFNVHFPVPTTDEQAKDRYNCLLEDLIKQGVRQLSTAPAYESVICEPKSKTFLPLSDDELLIAAQTVADGYKMGQRATGKTAEMKAKASAMDSIAAQVEAGASLEDIQAMIAKLKG